jgi:hypothetical protein
MKNRINYYKEKTEQRLFSESTTLEKAIKNEFEKLNEWVNAEGNIFDIFLSHSYLDKKIIYGLYQDFKEMGFSVYVDWINDRQLDRSKISIQTAAALRERMQQSKCLFYATSNNSSQSIWMPWELGYMDGLNGKVLTFPLLEEDEDEYYFPEYLSLYNYVEKAQIKGKRQSALWVHEIDKKYVKLDNWLNRQNPFIN